MIQSAGIMEYNVSIFSPKPGPLCHVTNLESIFFCAKILDSMASFDDQALLISLAEKYLPKSVSKLTLNIFKDPNLLRKKNLQIASLI